MEPNREWVKIAEFDRPEEAQDERWIAAGLAPAGRDLQLPAGILERMAASVGQALQMHRPGQTAPPRVRVLRPAGGPPRPAGCECWGFFVLQKTVEEPARQVIELFAYPEEAAGVV